MNTNLADPLLADVPISTEQIEAVLDPLLERLAKEFPDGMVSIDRRKHVGCTTLPITWSAYSGQLGKWSEESPSPQEACESLIELKSFRSKRRKAELEQTIANAQAELAKLQTP